MKEIEPLKPGVYPLPDGRTNTVLEVHDIKIDISQVLKAKLQLRIQELLKQGAEKEANNG